MAIFTSTLDRIKKQISKKGWTQLDFANAIGIDRSCISSWNIGRSKSYLKMLPQIAKALGVSVEYLIGDENEVVILADFTNTMGRIKDLAVRKGLNQSQLAKRIGTTRSTVNSWYLGRAESYKKMIPQIAEALGVSVGYLLGEENEPPIENLFPLPGIKKVPLLGTIACGEPILAVENISDFLSAPLSVHCDFALECKGDSMINARIFDGDIVYIRQQEMVENGEIAAILIDNEATLRRFYLSENKTVTLCACNPMYADMVFVGGETANIRVIGKAVAFTSFVR